MPSIQIRCTAADTIPLAKLVAMQGSLKTLSKENAAKLKKQILETGFRAPIFVWKDGDAHKILDGHQRLVVLKQLEQDGYTIPKLPVAYVEADSEQDAYRAILQFASQYGQMTDDGLKAFLDISGIDLASLGVDFRLPDIDLDALLPQPDVTEDEFDADAAAAAITKPITQPGDLWKLGDHRLLCGDATKQEDVDKLMDGKQADMVFTDPPYGVAYVGGTGLTIENDNLDEAGTQELWRAAYYAARSVLRDGAIVYATVPAGPLHLVFAEVMKEHGDLRQILVWAKDRFVLGRSDYHYRHEPILYGWKSTGAHTFHGGRDKDTVWEVPRPSANPDHPTMKPIALVARAIRDGSKRGEIVFDFFSGSGSTLLACEQSGRSARALELDPKYCDVIVKRWEQLTGQKAQLIPTH